MSASASAPRPSPEVSEQDARKVAEAARESEWKSPSFLKELFLGNFRADLVHPYPLIERERPEFDAFYDAFREFLRRPRSTPRRSTPRGSIRRTSSTACASSAPSASRSRRSTAVSASACSSTRS